jgi:hypothetical protein
MNTKQQFLEAIKNSYPDFDEELDSVLIKFSGENGYFNGFSTPEIWRMSDESVNIEGEFDLKVHEDLLFQIIDESGIRYNWNDTNVTGEIAYQQWVEDGEIEVNLTSTQSSYL